MSSVNVVHVAPRIPPDLFDGEVKVPLITASNTTSLASGVIGLVSLVALVISFLLLSNGTGGALAGYLPLLVITTGATTAASFVTLGLQRRTSTRLNKDLARRYDARLRELNTELEACRQQEAKFWHSQYPALDVVVTSLQPRANPEVPTPAATFWQRRRGSDGFLRLRVGTGAYRTRYRVTLGDGTDTLTAPPPAGTFIALQKRARALLDTMWMRDVPVTIPLNEHSSIALIPATADNGSLQLATIMAHLLASHAPGDIVPIVLYPADDTNNWEWYEFPFRDKYYEATDMNLARAAPGNNSANRTALLSHLLDELHAREASIGRVGRHSNGSGNSEVPPHIVVCVDNPSKIRQESGEEDRMLSSALTLAARRGRELGVTVLSSHGSESEAPSESTLIVDSPRGLILPSSGALVPPTEKLNAEPAPVRFDICTAALLNQLADLARSIRMESAEDQELRTNIPLAPLLVRRPNFGDVVFPRQWNGHPRDSLSVEVGYISKDRPLMLDLADGGDGPHGLLVGQTGSGKSVLLKTIIASLIARYPPTYVNLVLVDYKGGLAFGAFNEAPHTVAYLTNLDATVATARFLRMMESEIQARQQKTSEDYPHLVVIIDEFSEMLSGPDGTTDPVIMRSLLRIVRLGRELKIHLLFATQRPDASVERLRGAVQYRISLRTNTPEDSTLALGRSDAASIPYRARGRGYLLRGDNELILFQSARLNEPPKGVASTVDNDDAWTLIRNMAQVPRDRWPKSLPAPNAVDRTPLVVPSGEDLHALVNEWTATNKLNRAVKFSVPIGKFDRPIERLQGHFLADLLGYTGRLAGGPLLVAGDLNAGKTTTLQTLLLSMAELLSPQEIRFYVMGTGDAFEAFAKLSHTHEYHDTRIVNITDPFDSAKAKAMLTRFERAMADARTSGPALLLAVDDLTAAMLRTYFPITDERPSLLDIAIRGGQASASRDHEKKVFVAYSMAAKPEYNLEPLVSLASTRVSLFTNDPMNHQLFLGRKAPFPLEAEPGHGFVYTRQSVDEIQIYAPARGASDAEIIDRLFDRLEAIERRWSRRGGS